jgi:hypothetical protein
MKRNPYVPQETVFDYFGTIDLVPFLLPD